jgi:hypothetical protein
MPIQLLRDFVVAPAVRAAEPLLGALGVLALVATPMRAQPPSTSLKLDLEVGVGRTTGGGSRVVPGAFAFGSLVAASWRAQENGGPVVAVGWHAQWPFDYGTDCLVTVSAPQCTPTYPRFTTYAALVGWEVGRRRAAGSARALIGPAVMRTNESRTLHGVQGRLDVTKLVGRHAGLNLWTQGAVAAPFRHDRFLLVSGGAGVRLQR